MDRLWNSNYVKLWTANFLLYFAFMLLMPLLPIYLNDTFGANKQVIGIVLSGYTLTALLVRPFSGFVVDTLPRKKVLLVCYFLFFVIFAGYFAAGSLLLFAVVRTLHGAPFGATTVANSTVAIDVLPSSRRAEGIGYYGLSNNIATAIGPTVAIYLYNAYHNFNLIFLLSLVSAGIGFVVDATVKTAPRTPVAEKRAISLDRFFLLKGWSQSISVICLAFSYGILSTYVAIYGKEELGITGGTGAFFALFAVGLMLSRTFGSQLLRRGRVVQNVSIGVLISLCGYALFAAVQSPVAYYITPFVIGIGNGLMFPAFQTMFINLAENCQRGTANSTMFTSWDLGVGAGVLLGGMAAEQAGYHLAFWIAVAVNALGIAFFFAYAKRRFLQDKLR